MNDLAEKMLVDTLDKNASVNKIEEGVDLKFTNP